MQTVETCRDFFLKPSLPRHRAYEMLRARFVDGLPVKEIARRFGRPRQTVQTVIRDFKRACERGEAPEFFVQKRRGPKCDRKKPQVREHIVRLRARGYADTDIAEALAKAGMKVSVSLIDQALRAEGLIGLRKRTRAERERVKAELASGEIAGLTVAPPATPETPAVADVRELDVSEPTTRPSRAATSSHATSTATASKTTSASTSTSSTSTAWPARSASTSTPTS